MRYENYMKWVMEITNQEYQGDYKKSLQNIKHNGELEK